MIARLSDAAGGSADGGNDAAGLSVALKSVFDVRARIHSDVTFRCKKW